MAEGRRQEAWQHTAWLSAMIANTGRDPKKKPRPFMPDDFNPMVKRDASAGARKAGAMELKDMSTLRDVFTGKAVRA